MWTTIITNWRRRAPPSEELNESASLLVIGHSHVSALRRGYLLSRRRNGGNGTAGVDFIWLQQPVFRPNIVDAAGGIKTLNRAAVRKLDFYIHSHKPSALVCCILGNEYNGLGLARHPQPFDFYLPSDPDLPTDAGAEIIPLSLFEELARQRLETFRFYLETFSRLVSIPIISVPPPPPVPDEKHILAHPSMFASLVSELGVSPATLRLKIWKVFMRTQEQICQEVGVRFHRLPAAVFDSTGCLAKQYWNRDPTHGNARYGKLLLDGLLAASNGG